MEQRTSGGEKTGQSKPRLNSTQENQPADPSRQLLRHTPATLAYRGSNGLRGAPESFRRIRAAEETRTPAQILAK